MSDLVQSGMFSVMVVRVDDPNDPAFEGRLAEHVARSPAFFANAPVVLDVKNCTGLASADAFGKLRALFKRQHLMPVGIQNGNATQMRAAINSDLATFPAAAPVRPEDDSVQQAFAEINPQAQRPSPVFSGGPAGPGGSRVVSQPVRSGSQIYAREGDLVVLSPVSAGAEVIADGHIHIYGTLRGRAIAGATGDRNARIFVSKLEAELVCVAGHYLVSDAIAPQFRGGSVQIALVDDRLAISPM